MKKSTLLTMASVGAVALTSAMTFAAWDNLSDTTTSNEVTFKQINVEKAADIVEKARLRRSFPTERVSPALSARPGKRAGKPCCARLPNPPHMSARQAARWKRAACPARARDAFSKSKIWGRHREFGIQLGGLRPSEPP